MKGMILLVGLMAACIYSGCESDHTLKSTLPLNETIEIANFEAKYNYEHNIVLKMDSVLNDSRCPSNVQCLREGNA